ncbi:MAG TPA: TetR/AcrR family transcriptional regulator [Polyangia bacterium]|nr:TetR/AcrR family transcriptional regulator [Polyangia bacterium]
MKKASGSHFASRLPARQPPKSERRRPVQSRSQVTVDIVLQATLQVLCAVGYRKLTTTRVAEVAGVSVGTLYQYFPDKSALVGAVVSRFLGMLTDYLVAAVRAGRDEPPEVVLAAMVRAFVAAKRAHLDAAVGLRPALQDVDYLPLVRAASRRVSAALALLLRQHIPEAARAARVVVAAVNGAVEAALDERPSLLADDAFEREVIAVAVGYYRVRCASQTRRS